MINTKTLSLLNELEKNNNRKWFEAHKDQYNEHKKDFEEIIDELSYAVAQFDDAVKEGLMNEKRITKSFRVYRDIRFSKDKTPYKTNMSGFISYDVTTPHSPAYYLSIQPGGRSMIGGGLWMPDAPTLKKIRKYIDAHPDKLKKIEQDRSFKELFPQGIDRSDVLKTSPRGFSADHEAIKYLQLKSFTASIKFSDKQVLQKDFLTKVQRSFKTLVKLNMWIKKAVR